MLTSTPPPDNDVWVYETTSAGQEATAAARLVVIQPSVEEAYRAYEAAGTDAWALAPMPMAEATDSALLQSNFNRLGKVGLKGLRPRLLSSTRTCMRCDAGKPRDLDHHLPKGRFPEFSVLTLNLIPCCGPCNGKKGSRYKHASGAPLFLHPYYDVLPSSEPYLMVDTEFSVDGQFIIRFRVEQTPSMPADVFARLQAHFDALGLAQMYRSLAIDELGDQLGVLADVFSTSGASGVGLELSRHAASVERNRHPNHWRVRLLRTLATDTAFCEGGFRALASRSPTF